MEKIRWTEQELSEDELAPLDKKAKAAEVQESQSDAAGKKICQFYVKGVCRYGKACRNSHEFMTAPITVQEQKDLEHLAGIKLSIKKEGAEGIETLTLMRSRCMNCRSASMEAQMRGTRMPSLPK